VILNRVNTPLEVVRRMCSTLLFMTLINLL